MYNYNEINAVELSPTKKDYYQIWNELIEVSGKLSERWAPESTNESDPGVVLLKVLTAVADKLCYNIDANSLEAFMPSAAQEASMRKLCEMLGYNMRYYQSATTTARITYRGTFPANSIITIDQFTNLKDVDGTINYITLKKVLLTPTAKSATVECIEGELVTCSTDIGALVTLEHLDDNNRYYLPEVQIASNGIFVKNSNSITGQVVWEAVDNLNTSLLGERVYKFGYDSARGLPYLEFPEDVGSLIGAGLEISFVRTKGASGNISANTLQVMEKPSSWATTSEVSGTVTAAEATGEEDITDPEAYKDVELYNIANIVAARNGKNPETIDEAYWNYQKTIGTFNTLVTCRDYMNKIYQLTTSEADTTPLVSNIIVSDIRDDINRAYTLCTMTPTGIEYTNTIHKDDSGNTRMNYFDLMLYPFITITGLNSQSEFVNSFRYTNAKNSIIIDELEEAKTIAHHFCAPLEEEIACIKVYFQLNAKISTTAKVTTLEAADIENAAHTALYKEFNMRNMSFGEELPYDQILKVLENSDPRVKSVSLDDPKLYMSVCTVGNKEYPLIGIDHTFPTKAEAETARKHYMNLVLRNVLAGKIELFDYYNKFSSHYTDGVYPQGFAKLNSTASKVLDTEIKLDLTENSSISLDQLITTNGSTFNTEHIVHTETNKGTLTVEWNSPEAAELENLNRAINQQNAINIDIYEPGKSDFSYNIRYSISTEPANEPVLKAVTYGDTAAEAACYWIPFDKLGASTSQHSVIGWKAFDGTAASGAFTNSRLHARVYDKTGKELYIEYYESVEINLEGESVPCYVLYYNGGALKVYTGLPLNIQAHALCEIGYKGMCLLEKGLSNSIVAIDKTRIKLNLMTAFTPSASEVFLLAWEPSAGESEEVSLNYDTFLSAGADSYITDDNGELVIVPEALPVPTKIGSGFVVDTEFISREDPLVLSAHEVVQFRSPSFKTKMTYPAYVNYYAKLSDTRTDGAGAKSLKTGSAAIPATLYTLREFFDGGLMGYTETNSWNKKKSWEEKINSLPSGVSFMTSCFKTKSNDPSNPVNTGYGSIVHKEDNSNYQKYLAKYCALFTKDKTSGEYVYHEYSPEEEIEYGTEFYGLKITDANFTAFLYWLQGTEGDIIYRADISESATPEPARLFREKAIKGVYERTRSNTSRKVGNLVDVTHCKYTLRENSADSENAMTEWYVPRLWQFSNNSHTTDGLGHDLIFGGVPANTEYQLTDGEYVLFTYSTSEGQEDGVTVVKNVAMGKGDIVKLNFDLVDSSILSQSKSYTKTADYGPWVLEDGTVIQASDIPGMFTFGANEQLEQREKIEVKLDGALTNLYWELKNAITDSDGYQVFPFDASGSYILQPGEYLYYTDEAKESLAYYGSGSEIRYKGTRGIKRYAAGNEISAEQINDSGLVSAIPWTAFNLSGEGEAITIAEYQYVNLAEGDELYSVSDIEVSRNIDKVETTTKLDGTFRRIRTASYKVSGIEGTLPEFVINGCFWEARGKLELDMGPDQPQILTVHRSKAGAEVARSYLYLYGETAEKDAGGNNKLVEKRTQVYTPLANEAGEDPVPMSVYSSIDILGANGESTFVVQTSDSEKTLKEVSFKIGKHSPLELYNGLSLAMSSDLANFTKIPLGKEHEDASIPVTKLNVLVPTNTFGLVTLYFVSTATTKGPVSITTSGTEALTIFNHTIDGKESWWPTQENTEPNLEEAGVSKDLHYQLREGLNIIKVTESCELSLWAPAKSSDALFLGELLLVNIEDGAAKLNYKLGFGAKGATFKYKDTDGDNKLLQTSAQEIYSYIKTLDPDLNFFYTVQTTNNNGLDLNPLDKEDTLLLPKNWFDIQNINNKFIVSELDSDYFKKFVMVSKFSRS